MLPTNSTRTSDRIWWHMRDDLCGWVELESGVYCDPGSGGRWMHVADFLLSGAGTSKWL